MVGYLSQNFFRVSPKILLKSFFSLLLERRIFFFVWSEVRPKGPIYRLRWCLGLEKEGEDISLDPCKTQTQSKVYNFKS